jgi:hypothetical protein
MARRRPKLSEAQKHIIRCAPEGPGITLTLAEAFDVSTRYVRQIQTGTRGLPLGNGLGSRPWQLKNREMLLEWRRRRRERDDAAFDRAWAELDQGEPLSALPDPTEPAPPPGLFRGAHSPKPRPAKPVINARLFTPNGRQEPFPFGPPERSRDGDPWLYDRLTEG